jgi:hypothetical protein
MCHSTLMFTPRRELALFALALGCAFGCEDDAKDLAARDAGGEWRDARTSDATEPLPRGQRSIRLTPCYR